MKAVFGSYNEILVSLLCVMASRCDMGKLRGIYHKYEELIESKLNFNVVDVTTVVELDDNLRTVITERPNPTWVGNACLSSTLTPPFRAASL